MNSKSKPNSPIYSSVARGEIARKLQERNRHLDMTVARYYVDAVCDLIIAAEKSK